MKTFCEFFAGVGLVREGLQSNGWECQWANDISRDKMLTYEKNYGSNDFWLGDVWDVLGSRDSNFPESSFLYTASFPCTDLSVAGKRAGLAGEESGALNAVFDILQTKHEQNALPKVVLLENVKGFLTSHNGDDVIGTVKAFSDLGYYVDILELDAINFSAQSRPRVFCIAVLEDLAQLTMNLKPKEEVLSAWWSDFDRYPQIRSKNLKKVIKKSEGLNWGMFNVVPPTMSDVRLVDQVETIPVSSKLWWSEERQNHLYDQMSDSHKDVLQNMIASEQLSYGTVYRRMRGGRSMAELRTDGFAGCLRTPKGGSSKQILIEAGRGEWRVRLLTPREYARLQGVRDSFHLPQNTNQGYYAMGDAVCVPVINYIAENILESIFTEYNHIILNAA